MTKLVSELENTIGYSFQNKVLLQKALTHSSSGNPENYERLEFLGDRVLGLAIAALLYEKFPDEKEGDLAKRLASLVQGQTLAKLAVQISLGDYIQLSVSEREAGGAKNDHILADVFEALIGAMYLDAGFEPCSVFIKTQWADVLYTMKKPPQHPKTALQEWLQGKGLPLPIYEIICQSGPDHAPVFEVELRIKAMDVVRASGKSRAEAETQAAKIFMQGVKDE